MSSRFVVALLAAACVGAPAHAAAPPACGRCAAGSQHGYRTDAPRGDPAQFVIPLQQGSVGAGAQSAGGTTALGTSSAIADTATLKVRTEFTGMLADMPRWQRDDAVSAFAMFTDVLTFTGPGAMTDVTVNLPFDYVIGALSAGMQPSLFSAPIKVEILWGIVNDSFTGPGYRKTDTRYLDGQVAADQRPADPGLYFAPGHSWQFGTITGGAFAHNLSQTFSIPTGKAYAMSVRLETVTSNLSSTRFADASNTLSIAPFTGTFTSVTSATFGTLGATGYAPFMPTSAAVPEPGPWALMIVGFGAIGAVARRRVPAAA